MVQLTVSFDFTGLWETLSRPPRKPDTVSLPLASSTTLTVQLEKWEGLRVMQMSSWVLWTSPVFCGVGWLETALRMVRIGPFLQGFWVPWANPRAGTVVCQSLPYLTAKPVVCICSRLCVQWPHIVVHNWPLWEYLHHGKRCKSGPPPSSAAAVGVGHHLVRQQGSAVSGPSLNLVGAGRS